MARIDTGLNVAGKATPAGAFWMALGFVIAGFFIGQFASAIITVIFAMAGGGGVDALTDTEVLMNSLSNTQFYLAQAFYTIIFCFVTPWGFLKLNRQKGFNVMSTETKLPILPFALALLATFAFMLVNSWLVEWNSGITFPEALSGLEEKLRAMEDALAETTERLTTFDNFGTFLIAFVVIAILPGIGEELLFRGVLQNTLHRYARNKHVAIWLTAFIFAAIHLQFYGIAPRTMLGVLFGYLYVWSGNLRLAMVAHMTNNGLALCIAYYIQVQELEFDIDNPEGIEWWVSLIALVITGGLLFLFRNYYLRSNSSDEQVADDLSD